MILDTIAASTLERVAAAKEALPLAEQIARARDLDSNTGFPFEQALVKQGMSFPPVLTRSFVYRLRRSVKSLSAIKWPDVTETRV